MDTYADQAVFKVVTEKPKTKRNLEEQAKKEAQERIQEEFKRQEKKIFEDAQLKKKNDEYEQIKLIKEVEKRKQEERRRRKEEEQQRSTLEGRLAKLIADLNSNMTGSEITLSGVDMGPARWRILAKALEDNISLKELHIVRKAVADDEGVEIVKGLLKNHSIEKLELQGNNLGKNTAVVIGELLEINDSLRYLDLEGNELFDADLKDNVGIVAIAEGIMKNQCLIALNMSNCNLDNNCGILLANAMKRNSTVIDFDYRGNVFSLETIKDINESLKRNKKLYDEQRLAEWTERKNARKEDEYNEMIDITLQQEHIKKMSKG